MGTLGRLALSAVIGIGIGLLSGALAAPDDRSKLLLDATSAGKLLSFDTRQMLQEYQIQATIRAVAIGAGAGMLAAGLTAAALFLFTARRVQPNGRREECSAVELKPSKAEPDAFDRIMNVQPPS